MEKTFAQLCIFLQNFFPNFQIVQCFTTDEVERNVPMFSYRSKITAEKRGSMNRYLLVILLLASSTLSFFCNVASATTLEKLTYYTMGTFSGGCAGSDSTQITCNGLTLSYEAQPSTTLLVPYYTQTLPISGLGIFELSGALIGSPVSWSANFTVTVFVTYPLEKPSVSTERSLTGTISYNATSVGNPIVITWPVVSLNSPLNGGGLCNSEAGRSPIFIGSPVICIPLPNQDDAFVFIFNTAPNGTTILSGTNTPLTANVGNIPEPPTFLLLGTGTMFLVATVLLFRRHHAHQGAKARPGTA